MNASAAPGGEGCPRGCLFDVIADPSETVDLSAALPAVVASLAARLAALRADVWQTGFDGSAGCGRAAGVAGCDPANGERRNCSLAATTQMEHNGGFWGPFCDV